MFNCLRVFSRLSALSTCAFLLAFTSCSVGPPSLPSTKKFQLADDIVDKEIFNQYLWHASQVEALSSSITMEFSKAGFSKTIDANAAFEVPDKLRVEILPPAIGPPVLLLVMKDGNLRVLNRPERVFYTGEASSENILQLLGLPLSPKQLMRWLTGGIAISKGDSISNTAFYSRPNQAQGLLEVRTESGRLYKYLLNKDPKDLEISAFEIYDSGKKVFVSKYTFETEVVEDDLSSSEIRIPEKIESWLVKEGIKLTTSFKSYKKNPSWKSKTKSKLFGVKVPKSFEKRELAAEGLSPIL